MHLSRRCAKIRLRPVVVPPNHQASSAARAAVSQSSRTALKCRQLVTYLVPRRFPSTVQFPVLQSSIYFLLIMDPPSSQADSSQSSLEGADNSVPTSPDSSAVSLSSATSEETAPTGNPQTPGGFTSITLRKLFVGGLPFSTSSSVLKEHFDQFGPIEEAVVISDRASGKSKGYGFVSWSISFCDHLVCFAFSCVPVW